MQVFLVVICGADEYTYSVVSVFSNRETAEKHANWLQNNHWARDTWRWKVRTFNVWDEPYTSELNKRKTCK